MSFFKEIEAEAAVLVENGIYKQVPLYTRDGYVYAKIGGGFVRLMADGATSKAKLRLDFMSFDGALYRDALGRLCTDGAKGTLKALDGDAKMRLIGGPST